MIKYCKNKINSHFGKEYKVMIQILIKIFESLIFYKNYTISIIPRKKLNAINIQIIHIFAIYYEGKSPNSIIFLD
jgi:hypothetical protein